MVLNHLHSTLFLYYSEKRNDRTNFESTFVFRNCGSDAVLLFHCDPSDSRERHRHIVFSRWFKDGNFKDNYRKESLEVVIDQDPAVKHYIGYIAMRENQFLDRLQEEFDRFSYFMISPKS